MSAAPRPRETEVLDAAQRVLVEMCRYQPEQAFDSLLDAARHCHLSAVQMASGLLDLVADLPRCAENLPLPQAAAFEVWGRSLVRVNRSRRATTDVQRP